METNKKVYSSQTMNATEYMKEALKEFLISKKYHTVLSNVSCEVLKRFGKVSAVTTVKLTIKDKDENVYTLEDLNSENENMSWLIDFIKKKEDEAIMAFISEQNATACSKAGKKTKGNFVLYMCFST